MAEIGWDDSYSVNIFEIDKQHQFLFSLIGDLHQAVEEGKASVVVSEIISSLVNYVDVHFSTEEYYFKKYEYPETETHLDEHLEFVTKVAEFQKGLKEQKDNMSMDVLTYLNNWLANHIKISDRKYSDFLVEKGVR